MAPKSGTRVHARRDGREVEIAKFETCYPIELVPLPCWAGLSLGVRELADAAAASPMIETRKSAVPRKMDEAGEAG